ncbi:hypothetical protein PHYBOEH_005171 [Phytophthora boehmeriae]|uniref:SGNH hydrolase-type esterase domain-containing protein n=1 Tax=Phytophthora boehmeriae TaxID=109152 RepID=A0A8T1WMP3_9STRA|nr:hypothetical protein PHYBOEH_005171 [Phytophthora boehmeriae]
MASPLHLLRALLVFLTFTSCTEWSVGQSVQAPSDAQPNPRPAVLLAGDSLVEQGDDPRNDGWVSLLQSRYTRSADVMNRGLSGYNTRWFLKYAMPGLEDEISKGAYTPALIAVWLGTNDAVLTNGSNPEMHVPIADYTENLAKIVANFQAAAPDAKMLLITPPHVDDAARAEFAATRTGAKRGLLDRSNAETGNYARACTEAASKAGVPVLDLYSYFNAMPESDRNGLLQDGLHFNAAGHNVIDEQFQSTIETEFPDVMEKLQPLQFPLASKWVTEDPYIPANSTAN